MTPIYPFPRCTPESQGISSAAILKFIDRAEQTIYHLHSLMLLRHGVVTAEGWWYPYASQLPHMLFSLSKSFTSTGIGLLVSEGRLSIDDTVLSFFPGDEPKEVSKNLAAMQVRHLLTMTTGHKDDSMPPLFESPDGNWTKAFLNQPVDYEPGTHFLYDTGASYMLSAIVQKVAGMPLIDYLEPRLFEPLGIQGATWENSPQGINMGGFGLSIKTDDIARFGQLLLQKGRWDGHQLVPSSWLEQATSFQVPNGPNENPDWGQGYGFQFWRCRHNAYRGDGACGQFCVVLPEQDAVLAITAGVDNMQQVLNAAWEILLPAMQPESLPEEPVSQAQLAEKLANLALQGPQGRPYRPEMTGIFGKEYAIDPNPMGIQTVSLDFRGENCQFSSKDALGVEQVTCGIDAWREGTSRMFNPQLTKYAVRGAWTGAGVFTMDIVFIETPFAFTMTAQFEDDRLQIETKPNVAFGNWSFPTLVGRLA